MMRPIGLARGATALGAAWVGGTVIAMLTGSPAVVALLVAGLVAGVASAMTGAIALRHTSINALTMAPVVTHGEPMQFDVDVETPEPVWVEVEIDGEAVASGWAHASASIEGVAPRRGDHHRAVVSWSSAGRLGLVWWRRRRELTIDPLLVAASPAAGDTPMRRRDDDGDGTATTIPLPGLDDIDGVRSWRDGDDAAAIHWPSTFRARSLIVRQRTHDSHVNWIVDARSGTSDADAEAGRVRCTVEALLATRARVGVSVDGRPPIPIADTQAAARWSALFDLRAHRPKRVPWWQRPLGSSTTEPVTELTHRARWLVALAAVVPTTMLLTPLGYGGAHVLGAVAGIAAAAGATTLLPGNRVVRQLLGVLTALLLLTTMVDPALIGDMVGMLRHLLPQLLVALCVLQGFECIDRRAARVSLACSALLTVYAAGIRIDGNLGAWLVTAIVVIAVASQQLTRPDRGPTSAALRPRAIRASAVGVAVASIAAILAVVPVPSGPAQLTLPSWLESRRPTTTDGALSTSGGSPLLGGPAQGGGSRTGAGAGGYPGFSPTMDTSLRGDLGNEVVLRVRAPYPDYWRGQTFTRFDGRTWHVDEDVGIRSAGPEHDILGSIGDLPSPGRADFVQTYYPQVDLPNIVFAADRAERVLLDAPLWQRPDGGLRAAVVLPAGSAYTVISKRSGATSASLRADGDIALLGAPNQYLELPASTSLRTRELAQALVKDNTWDTIIEIEAWLANNVEYNLDAPVPPEGADAVDYFLFESRVGFCEQIATALTIMLRSLGVPARVATGYVPSERDEIAGVWISRASDAHAWVEVRFPSAGWVAIDPTASVPLSGEATRPTVGGEMVRAATGIVGDHAAQLVVAVSIGAALWAVARALRRWWQRRRRGRWGVLQDRFVAAAVDRGASPGAANAELAAVFDQPDAERLAVGLAAELDASAFSPQWVDDDARYDRRECELALLESMLTSAGRHSG